MNYSRVPYFVKTLDYAASSNASTQADYGNGTISRLIDRRARAYFDLPAVGVAVPGKDNWGVKVFSYEGLSLVVNAHAYRLVRTRVVHGLHDGIQMSPGYTPPVVALLSDSSLEMLINFLALVKIGYAVLLIDPQCTTRQITHLLNLSSSKYILASPDNKATAIRSAPSICVPRLLLEVDERSPSLSYRTPNFVTESAIAYIRHSNRANGMPKLILCPHSSAIANLAYQGLYDHKATFTTTPLYHGGITDFMRSLMASSMLWMYPSSVPITPKNILKALSVCQHPRAHYFSTVPYVLKVCAGDAAVVRELKDMDMVGFGGAPLEEEIGDFLVRNEVKLVSRFETSKCGLLVSSHRVFSVDMGWDYLRFRPDAGYQFITPRAGGDSRDERRLEFEVLSNWPQMNCQPNTAQGGYVTGDIFVRHPSISGLFKHVGRIDGLITLSNGKKLDPTIIERELGVSELALESFVFGDGRPFPGILVFPTSARDVSHEDILKVLGEVNVVAKIVPDMIVFPPPYLFPLRNTRKQLLRQATFDVFERDIGRAYEKYDLQGPLGQGLKGDNFEELEQLVRGVVMSAIGEEVLRGKPLESTTDLFRYGIDSITAVHIRNRLLKVVEIESSRLPHLVVCEQTSIAGMGRITEYILASCKGGAALEDGEASLMMQLVEKYDAVDASWDYAAIMVQSEICNQVVLLTGATGVLGGQIARQIVTERQEITQLYCLCRKESEANMEALIGELRRIAPHNSQLSISSIVADLDLADVELRTYDLLREVTIIIHAAWSVTLDPLSSFETPDISSVQQLLRLARKCRRKPYFVFCSCAAWQDPQSYIHESFPNSPDFAGELGYCRAKWVAEKICENAAHAGLTVALIRLGELSGHSMSGTWSRGVGWPMVIESLSEVGCLPDFERKLSWLPVDLAARGVLDIASAGSDVDTMRPDPVFNLGNMNTSTSWGDVLEWLEQAGAKFKRVSPMQWLEEVEKLGPDSRSKKPYPAWRANFEKRLLNPPPQMEIRNVTLFSDVLGGEGEGWKIEQPYIELIWKKWVEDGFLQ
ncbi:unnamed protein product [Tuber aestivum]|uniref:Carrier domain-containing protein n=1 Tax=Tuber aestivum TaxID=59557 RepID=A0A292PR91_9PEZI|nr:unnamed protein product [Tuber aestivum]